MIERGQLAGHARATLVELTRHARVALRTPMLMMSLTLFLTLALACSAGSGVGSTPPGGRPAPVNAAGLPADAANTVWPMPAFVPQTAPPPWHFLNTGRVVEAPNTMIVSNSVEASTAGDEILKGGGNAVDAAVATSFALAVSHPIAGNIGGGGFMIIRLADGRSFALDFRERAPEHATRTMFQDSLGKLGERSRFGPLAAGVPGSVAGMGEALRRFGTRSWKEVLAPSIALAEHGFVVDAALHGFIRENEKRLKQFGSTIFFRADGSPLAVGDTLRQPDLARTLRRIAEKGSHEFYTGETADLIVAEMARGGGVMTKADLATYTAIWREPLRGRFRGYEIITMPPPSAGGIVMLQTLNVIEGTDPVPPANSARYVHLLAETFRRAYIDRNTLVADPDFVSIPVQRLTSRAYADSMRRSIDMGHATPSPASVPQREGMHTTHYVVADAMGNVVSTTTTLNDLFGSKVMVAGAGFLLNDEMDDFAGAPGRPNSWGLVMGEANAIQPGKRMLSSMTPTIVVAPDGTPLLATGGAGGSRISTVVTQVVLHVLAQRMSMPDAMTFPRIHHQAWPDTLRVETNGFSRAVLDSLRAMGHSVATVDSQVNVMSMMRVKGKWQGVPEPRREGGAVGH